MVWIDRFIAYVPDTPECAGVVMLVFGSIEAMIAFILHDVGVPVATEQKVTLRLASIVIRTPP